MKWLLLLVMLIPFASACEDADFWSFCVDSFNEQCDPGEFPIMNQDCNLNSEEIFNLEFIDASWFLKILLVFAVLYLLHIRFWQDMNLSIGVVVILALIFISPSFNFTPTDQDAIMQDAILENNSFNETLQEKVLNTPERFVPTAPWIGWVLLFVFGALAFGLFEYIADWVKGGKK